MKSRLLVWMGCAALGATIAAPTGVLADEMEGKASLPVGKIEKKDYPNAAKIDLQDAVKAALKKVPGKATEAELESEDGFLVYEVKIATTDKKMTEVKVDAGNGNVLNIEKKSQHFD